MAEKSKRSSNFTEIEVQWLMHYVEKYQKIIEYKKSWHRQQCGTNTNNYVLLKTIRLTIEELANNYVKLLFWHQVCNFQVSSY